MQLFCDGMDRIETSNLKGQNIHSTAVLSAATFFPSFSQFSGYLPPHVPLWKYDNSCLCYQAFWEEFITRTAPAIAAVFSLNFWTGTKTLLAVKLWEVMTSKWHLDLKLNSFVETQRFGNDIWTCIDEKQLVYVPEAGCFITCENLALFFLVSVENPVPLFPFINS